MSLASLNARLRKLEAERRAHERAAERETVAARLLRDGINSDGVNIRRWAWIGPNGQQQVCQWEPWMGSWEKLLTLIDAAEDVAHGIPRGRSRADLEAEIRARTTRPTRKVT